MTNIKTKTTMKSVFKAALLAMPLVAAIPAARVEDSYAGLARDDLLIAARNAASSSLGQAASTANSAFTTNAAVNSAAKVVKAALSTGSAAQPTGPVVLPDPRKGLPISNIMNKIPSCSQNYPQPKVPHSQWLGDGTWSNGGAPWGKFLGKDCAANITAIGTGPCQLADAGSCYGQMSCHTEYYLAGYEAWYDSYVPVVDQFNCNSTTSCTSTDINAKQTCVTNSFGASDAIGITVKDEILGSGIDVSNTFTISYDHAIQSCNTATMSNACTWAGGCHSVYYSPSMMTYFGYTVQRCTMPLLKTNMVKQPVNPAGDYSVSSQDWQFDYASLGGQISCAGGCGQDPTPAGLPVGDGGVTFLGTVPTKS